jgi:hypothetical protein
VIAGRLESTMTSGAYTLEPFVTDLDRTTTRETAPEALITRIAPLLGRLAKDPDAIPARVGRRRPRHAARQPQAPHLLNHRPDTRRTITCR